MDEGDTHPWAPLGFTNVDNRLSKVNEVFFQLQTNFEAKSQK